MAIDTETLEWVAQNAFPLTSLQHSMLLQTRIANTPGLDVEQVIGDLRETVDIRLFERAWALVFDRHAALKTAFCWRDLPAPCQTVDLQAKLPFEFLDWTERKQHALKRQFANWLQQDRQRNFNLSSAPLMRVTLLRLAEDHYRFVWTFHHLLLDATAFQIVLEELFAFYEASHEGYELELAEPRAYRDYVEWLNGRDFSHAEPFWKQLLAAFDQPTPLPAARSVNRPLEEDEATHGEQCLRLAGSSTSSLKLAAQQMGVRLSTVIEACWGLLLARYNGVEDVAFGVVRACRRNACAGADTIVGLLINTVPMRIKVNPESPVRAWLEEVRQIQLGIGQHEQTPLLKILEWAEVVPGAPLFETVVNFQNESWEDRLAEHDPDGPDREFINHNQPIYPLWLDCTGGRQLVLKIGYDRSRFDDDTIERMLGHLRNLICGLLNTPGQRVADLSLIGEEERQCLLQTWNQTDAEYTTHSHCVQDLFEAQASRTPDALAVSCGTRQLTYRELNSRSNQLARYLQTLGVGPEAIVGIWLERSPELVIAILATLKAGGAFLPLDPSVPTERLSFMLNDSKAAVLITQQALLPRLCDATIKCVCIDGPEQTVRDSHDAEVFSWDDNPRRKVDLAHLAYVIYTSGSTGTPKGVAIEHRGLANLVGWHQHAYEIVEEDRATQLAGPAFDAAVWELWPYITAGASIHIPDEETRLSPDKLLQWLRQERITMAFLPTPLAEAVMTLPWPEGMQLRALLTGGDRLHQSPPRTLGCWLTNHYGPTENTVVTTAAVIEPDGDPALPPPIGCPIANTRVYILDRYLQPVPIGVPGELHISGLGLAREYLNQPDLTVAKFIPNPFANGDHSRLYKTGDLARYLPDGTIDFLGRIDQQIKIRGHRIEPGEVEAILVQHPGVMEAVVAAQEGADRQQRLVAYVVPSNGAPPSAKELTKFLRQKLPDCMVPSAMAFLDRLPLTRNGKIDRRSLPPVTVEADELFIEPRTEIEQIICREWAAVLGRERIGVNDNFFELGGHSLQATQSISRIGRALGTQVPLQFLFDAPTPATLAKSLTVQSPSPNPQPPDDRASARFRRNGTIPISFAQERLWFLEQLEPGLPLYNIPLAIEMKGELCLEALERSFSEIVSRHAPLRTAFTAVNGQPIATEHPATPIKVPLTDLRHIDSATRQSEAARLSELEARLPFDLSSPPLLRAQLLRLGDDHYWLLITTHHIASDGWSMGIFYNELTALYTAFRKGAEIQLTPLATEYTDFAEAQRRSAESERVASQLVYWQERLKGPLPTLALPTDRPRPATQKFAGATETISLPMQLLSGLKGLARQEEATLFMVLAAGLDALLARYTAQEDILIGSAVAGRMEPEAEMLIGLFVNPQVLRTDVSGNPTFLDLLKRVRTAALESYANQEVPFERILEAVNPPRDLSRSPFFQVMLILQNAPLQPLTLEGLKLKPLAAHSGTAKFDLTFSLEETDTGLGGYVEYNSALFDRETIARMLGHYRVLLEAILLRPELRIAELPLLTNAERRQLLQDWQDTGAEFAQDRGIHQLFENQVARTPEAIAVVCDDEQWTYQELDRSANEVAKMLVDLGIQPSATVAICMPRSLQMMAALLGILKAGASYVPLDPAYPRERLAFMLQDSKAAVLLTSSFLQTKFAWNVPNLKVVCLDELRTPDVRDVKAPKFPPTPQSVAYVIYTSGSTGKPKGVMVTHRNVVNFFTAMDKVLGTAPGVWLAVTSISFDISVLELFWPLTRGFKVVIQQDREESLALSRLHKPAFKQLDFSLFYFGSDAGDRADDKYRLLIEGAKFADQNGFAGIWTPERHFHRVGGLYPNPSVTSAALAMITRRLQIRAGSVVLPLHHPVRVAEEWAVVDNLSHGRAALSFASGWHANDFAIASENFARRKEVMFAGIQTIRRLWAGEPISATSGSGAPIEIRTFPKPVQKELPMWLTSAGNEETFQMAGELGLNVLTHVFGQSMDSLAKRIQIYRAAYQNNGHAGKGRVSLMLHTFVAQTVAEARQKVHGPLREYLRTYRDLSKTAQPAKPLSAPGTNAALTGPEAERALETLLDEAVDRYFETSGLFGTPDSCLDMIEKLRALDVDELACLIDFGVDSDSVLASLEHLNELRKKTAFRLNRNSAEDRTPPTLPELITRHHVTHLQCTPSLAGTLLLAPESVQAMRSLGKLLLGGEALPYSLLQKLRPIIQGDIINMYGPTETTIWSATCRVNEGPEPVPIGKPIANTSIYILDAHSQLLPIGIPGEIYIGGAGVALGYLDQPQLTQEKFVPDPFSNDPDKRLYRTGDLGRFRPDGSIEFLGRVDHQVKIRGQRIELGEIETVLRQHPLVHECALRVWEHSSDDKRLVAYLTSSSTPQPNPEELRRYLEDQLPATMVPSTFIFLDKLPLTPNGKINRNALPEPAKERPVSATSFVAPGSTVEKAIADIWSELLRVEKVGLDDNFFDLGGHSLLVLQVQARLQQALAVDLPVVKLFQFPTIRSLARFLSEKEQQPARQFDRGRRKQAAFARGKQRQEALA